MGNADYRKQIIKIGISISLLLIFFPIVFILSRLYPGTFNEYEWYVKVEIISIAMYGIFYPYILIKYLSTEKNIKCMRYYEKKRLLRKQKNRK